MHIRRCVSNRPTEAIKLIKIAHINPCSVRNKTADIIDYVVSSSIDICCITETWLKENDAVSRGELKPEGYDFKDCPRAGNRAGGGTGILYRDNLTVRPVSSGEKQSFEFSSWKVAIKNKNFVLHIIYRPPYSANHRVTTSIFFDEFTEYVSEAAQSDKPLLITGDFNIHMNDENNLDQQKMSEMITMFNLEQHVYAATHRCGGTLDLFITRDENDVGLQSPEVDYMISDHSFIVAWLNLQKPPLTEKDIITRNLKKIDNEKLNDDLHTLSTSCLDIDDINLLADAYSKGLAAILDKHAPQVSMRVTVRPKVPWFSARLKELKRDHRKAEKIWRRDKNAANLQKLHSARNKFVHELNESRRNHVTTMIDNANGDQKKLYRVINRLLNKNPASDTSNADSSTEFANTVGKFFEHKIDAICSEFDSISDPVLDNITMNSRWDAFKTLTSEEVKKLIMKSSSASCASDPIPTWFLKEHIDSVLPMVTHILNTSMSLGKFPAEWKKALIIPLLKKPGLQPVPLNYRPISNLQYIAKLVESAVVKQLSEYCDTNDVLPCHQSAYRAGYSTELAMLKVQSDILLEMDQQKVCQLVLIDYSSAFDTVSHPQLLNTLTNHLGIDGTVRKWFQDYLSSRSQRVLFNGALSESFELTCGVPQGSCLGPMLFTLYASPVFEVIHKHGLNAHGYADDVQFYGSFNPNDTEGERNASYVLEECATDIMNWSKAMNLKMNETKTDYLVVGTRQQIAKLDLVSVNIGNHDVNASESVKNLGTFFDKNMNMEVFVLNKCKAAYRQLFSIGRIRKCLTYKDTEMLIHSLVHSQLDYCNSLLAGIPKYLIKRLQLVQNTAARILCQLPKYAHITPVLMRLHWLPVEHRINYKICVIVFKALYGTSPGYIRDMVQVKTATYFSRSSTTLTLETTDTTCKTLGDRAFRSYAPRQWNKLPPNIRAINNIHQFKRKLKAHYFLQAFK